MGKEVQLKPAPKKATAKVKKEVQEELVAKLSQSDINIENAKRLRKTLKGIQNQDLIGYIILFDDHKTKRVGVLSSIDQAVSQFVALAHGGYVDKYDQIINQCITTRTIDNMKVGQPEQGAKELPAQPKQLEKANDREAKEKDVQPPETKKSDKK